MRPPLPSARIVFFNRNSLIAVALLGVLLVAIVTYLQPKTHAQSEAANNVPARTRDKRPEVVPGELLVRFRPGTAVAQSKTRTAINVRTRDRRNLNVDLERFGGSELIEGLRLARVPAGDANAAMQALSARADVEYAEPNYIRYTHLVPNDPQYSQLWGLKNTGGGISAESAWNQTTGSQSVVVGVIDTGIDIQHLDLKDNIFVNPGDTSVNGVDDDGNGFIDDVNGWDFFHNDRTVFDNADEDVHGTHVAGTIGARGNNGIGVVGVNWNVQLLPLKAGGITGAPDTDLLEAYNYAKMMRQRGINLRVLNNSYGSPLFSITLRNAIKELGDAGILFIASAGNDTLNNDHVPQFPASYELPNVISVAASTQGGFFATSFSNRGPQTVHLGAPGEDILSTTPRGYTGPGLVSALTEADGSTYSFADGTSMAAPHVTGAAALACAANPGISLEKLRAAVLFGVDEGGGFFNQVMTNGRLNANRTVQFATENDSTPPAPASDYFINSQEGRRVQIFYREAGDDGTTGRASLREVIFVDAGTNEQFRLNAAVPSNPGVSSSIFVSIPYKHTSGQLLYRTTDNVGNTSTASVNVAVAADVADPYTVSLSAPSALTPLNSGTRVGSRGDDLTSGVNLPFPFPFFGTTINSVVMSTNGVLYFQIPPDFAVPNPNFAPLDFAIASPKNLEYLAMVAGMWADLRTDRNATDGVYMVQPDIDRVILRWQGVTFGTETPVNFEIELRRDGTIQTRYGSGNANLNRVVVGISGGDPEAYPVASHSSEQAPLSLTNAQTVTFALRNPPPPPVADLAVSVATNSDLIFTGQNITYNVRVTNLGPNTGDLIVMNSVLPAGTTFVSCSVSHFSTTTCTNASGTVTGRINTLQQVPIDSVTFNIVATVNAAPGASLQHNVSVSGFRFDPNSANNSASVTTSVVAQSFFGNARAIAAGGFHTTGVKNDGTVWSWGTNSVGQLGDGTGGIGMNSLTPLQVPGLDGVETVEDSNAFILALKSNGTVWGWGFNGTAQLGDGTTFFRRTRPVQTVGLTNVRGIAAGDFFGAAVKTDGTVWVWGANFLISNNPGQLTVPVQIPGLTNVTAITAGSNHLLMLKSDKTVWAIGGNNSGELGDGTTTSRTTPVQVVGLSNVTRIAAGSSFSLALKEDGTVWAFGFHGNGQLGPSGGNIDFSPHPNPVQVTGLPAGIVNLAAGETFCLALANDSTVWGWGDNSRSQLGHDSQTTQNPVPKQIQNFGNVVAIAGGRQHSVALKADGSVWAWGNNQDGEVGDGTANTARIIPVQVSGLGTVNSPVITPPGGRFFNPVHATITCPTPGAVIHYTTNGNEPTQNDPMIPSGGTIHITTDTIVRARAWKPGLFTSGTSLVGFEKWGPSDVPTLFVEQEASVQTQLAAFDSVLLTRDPFPVINLENLMRSPTDPNTRVVVYVHNLQQFAGDFAAAVTVQLRDAQGAVFNVPAEDVRMVPSDIAFRRVTFRLPNNLAVGTCEVRLFVNDRITNAGTIRIKP